MHDHTPSTAPTPSAAPPRWNWRELLALALAIAVLTVWLNHAGWDGYERWLGKNLAAPNRVFKTYDEYFLVEGYRKAPDLWRDGLSWWHGNWIHTYTAYFRPLGSYLHWGHCYVGLRCGWQGLGWLGLSLYWAASLVAAAFTWRVTRSKPATILGALLLPFHQAFNNSQPSHWAVWWPGHPDIVTGGLLVGSLLCLDLWFERGRRRLLAGAWLLLALACGFK